MVFFFWCKVLISEEVLFFGEEVEENNCYIMSLSNEIFLYVLIYMDVRLVIWFSKICWWFCDGVRFSDFLWKECFWWDFELNFWIKCFFKLFYDIYWLVLMFCILIKIYLFERFYLLGKYGYLFGWLWIWIILNISVLEFLLWIRNYREKFLWIKVSELFFGWI